MGTYKTTKGKESGMSVIIFSLLVITSLSLVFLYLCTKASIVSAQESEIGANQKSSFTSAPSDVTQEATRMTGSYFSPTIIKRNDSWHTPSSATVSKLGSGVSSLMSDASSLTTSDPESDTSFLHAGAITPQLSDSDNFSGAFSYQFPLEVPEGRNGLTPELSLDYSNYSSDHTGFYGYGWDIQIPYIKRINKIGSEDLYSTSFFFSSLSGELTTTDSSSTFFTTDENGDFLRYYYSGSKWVVTDKSGTTYTFGSSTSGKMADPNNSTHVYAWFLEEVRDLNGNFIRYAYMKDKGQIYPATITYTGNNTTNGIFVVEFLTQSRTDVATSSEAGFPVVTRYRIHEIRSKINGSLSKRYILAFIAGDNSSSTLLSSITETGYNTQGTSTSLPATEFGYSTSTTQTGFVLNASTFSVPELVLSNRVDMGVRVADVNGDGFDDLVKGAGTTKRVYLNTGTGWLENTSWVLPESFVDSSGVDLGTRLIDMNGDGRVDIVRRDITVNKVYLNNGSGWTETSGWSMPVSFVRTNPSWISPVRLADANGDGLVDVWYEIEYDQYGWEINAIYLNNGNGTWTLSSQQVPGVITYEHTSQYGTTTIDANETIVDITGDGCADFIRYYDPSTVYINTCSGWNEDPLWTPRDQMYSAEGGRAMDVNGDTLTDLVTDDGVTFINTGRGWKETNRWAYTPLFRNGTLVGDFDGDGLGDVIQNYYNPETGTEHTRYLNAGIVSDQVVLITNPKGGKTKVVYQSSASTTTNPSLPMVLQTVYQTVTDDRMGNVATTTYSFGGGLYYFGSIFDRKFAGFATTTTTDAVGNVTKTYYHQGNSSQTSKGEYQDNAHKIGKPYRIEKYGTTNNLYTLFINKWGMSDINATSSYVKLESTTELTYDGDGTHKDKAESYTYGNGNGNLLQKIEWGEVTANTDGSFSDTGSDKRTTNIDYAFSESYSMMSSLSNDSLVQTTTLPNTEEPQLVVDTLPASTFTTPSNEVLSKRTYNSRTFDEGNGTYRLETHVGHIFYKDELGVFQPSDIRFEDKGNSWSMTKSSYNLTVSKNFTDPQLIRYDNKYDGANHSIVYEPQSLAWYNPTTGDTQAFRESQKVEGVRIGDNVIRYTDAFGTGIDFEVTLYRSGFKKEIVIRDNLNILPTPPASGYKLYALFKYSGKDLDIKKHSGDAWNKNTAFSALDGFTLSETANPLASSFIRPAYAVDSAILDPLHINLDVTWFTKNNSLWQAKEIPLDKLTQATYPVRLDTMTSYYAGGGDGFVEENTPYAPWSTMRSSISADVADYTTTPLFMRNQKSTTGSNYTHLTRSIFQFDTSAIGSASTISSSTVYIHADSANTFPNFTCAVAAEQVNLTTVMTAGDAVLSIGDYALSNYGSTPISATTTYTTWDQDAYMPFTLNSTGLGSINKTGFTKVSLRTGADIYNTSPGCADYGYRIYGIDTSESAGTGEDPYIVLTYTTGGLSAPAKWLFAPKHEIVKDQNNVIVKNTEFKYDGLSYGSISKGNLTRIDSWANGATWTNTQKEYNAYGLVTKDTDERGKYTTYTYDPYNLYVATSTNPLTQKTYREYDYSSGKVTKAINPNGFVLTTTYDGLDRPLEEKQPDFTTPTTLVTKSMYAYVDNTVPTSVHKTDYLDSTLSVDLYQYYDGFGRSIQSRTEAETSGTFVVSDTVYDKRGLILKSSLPYFASGYTWSTATTTSSLFTRMSYDPLARPLTLANAVGTTTYAYSDWRTTITDASGTDKYLYMDALRNLVRVDERIATSTYAVTQYTYDTLGNLKKITDTLGNIRNFTYDNLGHRLTAQDLHASADGTYGTWYYSYDLAGNLASSTDPKSQNIQYTYDDVNRVLTEDFTGLTGTEVTYTYDSCTNGIGYVCVASTTKDRTTYTYNPYGKTATTSKAITGIIFATGFTYDRQGNQILITYPDNAQVRNTYNTAGLLEKIEERERGGNFANIVSNIDYGPHGKPVTKEFANGTKSVYTYDTNSLYRLRNVLTGLSSGMSSMMSSVFGTTVLADEMIDALEKVIIGSTTPTEIYDLIDDVGDTTISTTTETATSSTVVTSANIPDVSESSTTATSTEDELSTPLVSTEPVVMVSLSALAFTTPANEVLSKRTYNSRTFDEGNGTYRLETHVGHIFYKDELGVFQPSDIRFEDKGNSWSMIKSSYNLTVSKNFTDPQLIRYDNKYEGANHSIVYEPQSLAWYNPITGDTQAFRESQKVEGIRIGDNVIRYTDAFGTGIDFEVTLYRSGFKKEIVIRDNLNILPTPPASDYKLYALFKYTGKDVDIKKHSGDTWSKDATFSALDGFTLGETANPIASSFIRPAYAVDSAILDPLHINLDVTWFTKDNSLWQAKEIPLDKLTQATYPVRFDTMTSYYAGAGDGVIFSQGNTTWTNVRNVGASVDYTGTPSECRIYYIGTNNYSGMSRSYFPFDTSGIPDDATIDSATVYINIANKISSGTPGWDGATNLTTVTRASPTTLSTSDYAIANHGNTKLSNTSIPYASKTIGAYETYALNTSGLATISKTAYTSLAYRQDRDIDNSAPTGTAYSYLIPQLYTSEAAGTGQDPYISVTYTTGTSTPLSMMQNITYTYDALGNITQIVDSSGTKASATTTYTYDYLSRLTRASTTQATSSPYLRTYDYNYIGNITSASDLGTYTYAGTGYANPHAVTGIGSSTYTYDNNGNLTADGARTNTWDYRNQLSQTVKSGTTYRYLYDSSGQRITYFDGIATTTYPNMYYDVRGATSTKHIYLGGELVATIEGNGVATSTKTIHTDHLGGTNVVTNASGTVVQTLSYYPYGSTRVDEKSSSFAESKKFTGHEYDGETGLYYMNARYQNPGIGRFVSQDPMFWEGYTTTALSNPQAFNSYSYANNNPITSKDPDGKFAVIALAPAIPLGPIGWAIGGTVALFSTLYLTADYFDSRNLQTGTIEYAGPRDEMLFPSGQQNPNDLKPPRDNLSKWRNALYFGLGSSYLGYEVYSQFKEHKNGIQKNKNIDSTKKQNSGGECINCGKSNSNSQSKSNNNSSVNPTTSSSNKSSTSNKPSSNVNWNVVRAAVKMYYRGGGK